MTTLLALILAVVLFMLAKLMLFFSALASTTVQQILFVVLGIVFALTSIGLSLWGIIRILTLT